MTTSSGPPPRDSLTPPRQPSPRAGLLVALGVGAVAVVGFITGTRGREGAEGPPAFALGAVQAPDAHVRTAPTHAELGSDLTRYTDARQAASFAHLSAGHAERARATAPTDAERAADVARRATLRAYDGAPPRVPHAVWEGGTPDCLACHEHGIVVAGHVAPPMSHEPHPSCPQCHVPSLGAVPGASEGIASGPPWDTSFVGLAAPTRGPRATPGAPPVIPHPTRMRERCVSCHGALATGLASSHPWRQSCLQCHAPSAVFEAMATFGVGREGEP